MKQPEEMTRERIAAEVRASIVTHGYAEWLVASAPETATLREIGLDSLDIAGVGIDLAERLGEDVMPEDGVSKDTTLRELIDMAEAALADAVQT